MIHTKITRNGQITIPKPLREELGVEEGDYMEVVRVPEGLLLKPKKMHLVNLSEPNKTN